MGTRDGRPLVLLHGNPTWGYLYRNFIDPLVAAGHRAIVPDYLGFGRSDKPDEPGLYRIPRHADRLDALLESLDPLRLFRTPVVGEVMVKGLDMFKTCSCLAPALCTTSD